MKLLELTDFHSKTKKEYIVVERLIRFEPYTHQFVNIKSEDREVYIQPSFIQRLFGQKPQVVTKKVELSREVVDRNGSTVVLSDDVKTMVLESPEEIASLLAKGKFTKVKGV